MTKIVNIDSRGFQQTYNLRMRSEYHNYITNISSGQPIHANSHSCAYSMIAYWCAWLKAHFPPEWWAAVMSYCKTEKIPRYMNTARLEGVKFGHIQADNLTYRFSVNKDLMVTPGLISIKGVGEKSTSKLKKSFEYDDIDHFVTVNGKHKRLMEPLIKLGAFDKWHSNRRATWVWYQYKYCSGKDITKLRNNIKAELIKEWTDQDIKKERDRQANEYHNLYPRRKRLPAKIVNWSPKPNDFRENVMALYEDDFSLEQKLEFEKEYLGFYWHSPLDLYRTDGHTIEDVKKSSSYRGKIEVVVEKLVRSKTKTGKRMGKLKVTDGLSNATIMIWSNQLTALKPFFKDGIGLRMNVVYDPNRNNFTLSKSNSIPVPLERVDEER